MSANPTPRGTASRLSLLLAALALFTATTYLALMQAPRPDPWKPNAAWEAFYYPVEQNAFARLPSISENLNDVFVVPDTEEVWAVGDGGMIVHSRDGGNAWAEGGLNGQRRQATDQDLNSVFFSADNMRGWAVGAGGTILATIDGGRTWLPQASGSKANLTNVQFLVDGLHGWVVGGEGSILVTTDGGKTWQSQASGSKAYLGGVKFLEDGLRGWAVGGEGSILVTADGGKTWQSQASGSKAHLGGVQFLADGLRGWAVGGGAMGFGGAVLTTTDGGKSWHSTSVGEIGLNKVQFLSDGLHGWIIGKTDLLSQSIILTTEDGGKNWKQITSQRELNSLRFLKDGLHGWIVGGRGAILTTEDGGNNWGLKTTAYTSNYHGLQFLDDSLHGWVAGGDGTILSTTDGGNSWKPQASGVTSFLHSLQFLKDGLHGWVAGDNGTILYTVDGGHTWQKQNSGITDRIWSLKFLADGLNGWAVGGDLSWGSDMILHTTDGGKSWAKSAFGSRENLASLQFLEDGLHGWAVVVGPVLGSEGTVLSTIDGGKTWRIQHDNIDKPLYAVRFLSDGLRGWTVGGGSTWDKADENSIIMATKDGGKTWQPQNSGTMENLLGAQFLEDGLRGWVVGNKGTIIFTSDGGKTWQSQASGTKEHLSHVQFLKDGLHGWAVGDNLTILSTINGGKTWKDIEYRRYPAPWYWLICIISLIFAWQGAKHRPKTAPPTVADLLASDRPLQTGDVDALDYSAIALGVSRFLRNPRTEPPLTLAITGEWGTGKSSLMNLIRDDLRREGFATVWFNAWHHQKGEQMLASLSASLRAQAIPHFLSLAGLRFRLNLLSRRGIRHWLWALGLATVAAYLVFGHTHLTNLLAQLAGRDGGWLTDSSKALLQSIPVLGGLAVLYQASQGFGLDPAKLIASVSAGKGQTASLDPGARFRFAEEFADVTTALAPGRLVIFIDDLDRCSKENVVEVLESLSFLASSGDCFIVLGMAQEWVETCVALGFKELAQESSDGVDDEQHREHRREFARQYLQKLINIEVPLPKLEASAARGLLPQRAAQVDAPRSLGAKAWDAGAGWLRAYRNVLTILGLLGAGAAFGWILQTPLDGWLDRLAAPPPSPAASELPLSWNALNNGPLGLAPKPGGESGELVLRVDSQSLDKGVVVGKLGDKHGAEVVLKRSASPKPGAAPASPAPTKKMVAPAPEPKPSDKDAPRFTPGLENTAPAAPWLPVGPGLLLAGLVLWLLLRRPVELTEDSDTFVEALNAWHLVIATSCPTPRLLKRYLNWVRFLAMRYRPMNKKKPGLWARLRFFRKPKQSAKAAEVNDDKAFDEKILVALSAIYQFRKKWVTDLAKFEELQSGLPFELLMLGTEQLEELEELVKQIKQMENMQDEWARPIATERLREKHNEQSLYFHYVKQALATLTPEDWQKACAMRERFLDVCVTANAGRGNHKTQAT